MVPKYRFDEIKIFYEIFCKNTIISEKFNLYERKKKFKKLIKCKYNWVTNEEYEIMYSGIKEKELEKYINIKKIEIEKKYKQKIIGLFCSLDKNNNNILNLEEFKYVMYKLNIFDREEMQKNLMK